MDQNIKKPTVKDVAREAGVSVATVSYIMNDRKDQKISEETRKKVLQIANLLNYRPSHAAKTLATGRTNLIGIAYRLEESTPARNMEITCFVNLLIERLNRMSYNVLFICADAEASVLPLSGNLDGILAIDLPHDLFRKLADSYLVPVISVDMFVGDPLFYQIYTDYSDAFERALALHSSASSSSAPQSSVSSSDAGVITLVMDDYANEAFDRSVKEAWTAGPVCSAGELCSSLAVEASRGTGDSCGIESRRGAGGSAAGQFVCLGAYAALMLGHYLAPECLTVLCGSNACAGLPAGVRTVLLDSEKKANLCISILLNAIDRNFNVAHDFPV